MTDRLLGVEAVPRGEPVATDIAAPAAPQVASSAPLRPAPAAASPSRAAPQRTARSAPAPAARPMTPQPGPPGDLDRPAKLAILDALDRDEVKPCEKCELCRGRLNTVFGEGDPDAPIMFIGEGPGQNEDEQGRPFVGRAGDLLEKMIVAMGLSRDRVYIANTVKCRPPNNRAPTPIEVDACWDYLHRQIATIRPRAIVTLGGPAAKAVLKTNEGVTRLRGQWFEYSLGPGQGAIPVMPTFHPAYVLRNYTPETRGKVWSDLQQVMRLLGLGGGEGVTR